MLIRRRIDLFTGLAHLVHDIPQGLGAAFRVGGGGLGAQHGCAVAYGGVDVAGDEDGHLARGRDQLDEDVVLALGTGHEDGGDAVTGLVHGLDDLAGLEGDELQGGVVVKGEAVDGFVAGQADHGAGHAGVRDRGAVPEQVAVEEDVAAQVGDAGGLLLGHHLLQVLVQELVDVGVVGFGDGDGVVEGRVRLDDMFEKLARRGLASFGHPVAGDDGVAVGSPDARDEDGIWGHGEVAGRGACHGGQTAECLRLVVLGHIGAQLLGAQVDFGANGADPACVGVDDTAADGDASR